MAEWARMRTLPPVLLLSGPTGVGKRALAHYLGQWILCEISGLASHGRSPCGKCSNCLRAIAGTWVDFVEVLPEEDSSESLKVEQFRKIRSSMGFGAYEGSHRMILIPNADRMTPQAANSMLKLLEEPPPGWVFFLTARDPALLLPTLVSRCQVVRLKPFSLEELTLLLEIARIPKGRQGICASLAQGSWERAVHLASEETWVNREILFQFLVQPENHLNALMDWAALSNRNFNLLVDQLELITLDLLKFSLSEEQHPDHYPWMNSDGKNALSAHTQVKMKTKGRAPAGRFWLSCSERLAQAREQALTPVNRKVLIQDLLLPWLA